MYLCIYLVNCAGSSLLLSFSLAAVSGGWSLVVVHGLLPGGASLVADQAQALQHSDFRSCGAQARLLGQHVGSSQTRD